MTARSTRTRHSYVPLYTADWLAGTARMSRLVKSVYHDICLYTWDTARKVPDVELILMLSDMDGGQGDKIVDALVKIGKLHRDEDGNVWSPRALAEAEKALELWRKKSSGGKKTGERAAAQQQDSGSTPPIEKETETETDVIGGDSPPLVGGEEKSGAAPAGGGEPPKPAEPKEKRISAGTCAEVFAAYNVVAKELGLSVAAKMTGSREGAIRARLEELGADMVNDALKALPDCQYVIAAAKAGKAWPAIDWFLRPNTIPRIMEGAYRTASNGAASAWKDME